MSLKEHFSKYTVEELEKNLSRLNKCRAPYMDKDEFCFNLFDYLAMQVREEIDSRYRDRLKA